MAATHSPNAVARDATTMLKRPVTAKAVRGMARSIIARFDKVKHPEYQGHAYTAAERTVLLNALKARAARSAPAPVKAKAKPKAKPKVVAPEA